MNIAKVLGSGVKISTIAQFTCVGASSGDNKVPSSTATNWWIGVIINLKASAGYYTDFWY